MLDRLAIYIYICIDIYKYIYIYVCVYVYMHVCFCINKQLSKYIYFDTCVDMPKRQMMKLPRVLYI